MSSLDASRADYEAQLGRTLPQPHICPFCTSLVPLDVDLTFPKGANGNRMVVYKGTPLPLKGAPADIVAELYRQSGGYVSNERLRAVFAKRSSRQTKDKTLQVWISRVRTVFRDYDIPFGVVTQVRVGYTLKKLERPKS